MSGSTFSLAPVAYHLAGIRRRERLGHAEQRRVQARRLRELVRHAYANVPHYRRAFARARVEGLRGADDLAGFPVLDRMDLHRAGTDLLAAGYEEANTRVATTSGSSGVPVTIRSSERDLGYLRATYLQDLLASGLRPTDRIAYFRVNPFLRHPLERLGVLRNFHIGTDRPLDEQVTVFLAARPTFLIGFPNVIASVVDELTRRGIAYDGVRSVLFGGERLTSAVRAHVLDYFGARHHEVYACVETFTIARACPQGNLHLRTSDLVVEVEHEDGSVSVEHGRGEVLLTRLRGRAMPLIRYRLGDRVHITSDDCRCERDATPIVREVLGRSQDRIAGHDGRRYYGDFLTYVVQDFPEVTRMQVLQRRPGAVEVVIVPAAGARDALAADVARALRHRSPGLDVTVRTATRITPEANGKIKIIKVLEDRVLPDDSSATEKVTYHMSLKETINQSITEHLKTTYTDDHAVRKLSQHYRREGYVKLPGLVPQSLFTETSQEVHRLLDLHEKRIDIHLAETGNSPRYMSTISQQAIAKDSELIPAIYESEALMGFLSRLAAQPVVQCPWDEEKYIAIRQHKQGDTHGWHWGDFSFTVIWIIEAPEAKYGGQLQTVPHTDWNKQDPRVEEYLQQHPIKTWGHATGDLYFLRSDTTLHRTIPLNADKTRIILNTCWGSESDAKKEASHETMHAMFD